MPKEHLCLVGRREVLLVHQSRQQVAAAAAEEEEAQRPQREEVEGVGAEGGHHLPSAAGEVVGAEEAEHPPKLAVEEAAAVEAEVEELPTRLEEEAAGEEHLLMAEGGVREGEVAEEGSLPVGAREEEAAEVPQPLSWAAAAAVLAKSVLAGRAEVEEAPRPVVAAPVKHAREAQGEETAPWLVPPVCRSREVVRGEAEASSSLLRQGPSLQPSARLVRSL